jgi:hypothetical protein
VLPLGESCGEQRIVTLPGGCSGTECWVSTELQELHGKAACSLGFEGWLLRQLLGTGVSGNPCIRANGGMGLCGLLGTACGPSWRLRGQLCQGQ